jgi:type 1 glutamine amidotransferase
MMIAVSPNPGIPAKYLVSNRWNRHTLREGKITSHQPLATIKGGAMIRTILIRTLVFSVLAVSIPSAVSAAGEKILVFKDSITYSGHRAGIAAAMVKLRGFATANAFTVDTTTKFTDFNTANLAKYDAVILMYPEKATASNPGTGVSDTMSPAEGAAFKSWFLSGKGYVGVHCDTRQNPNWTWWYDTLVGAKFVGDVGPISANFHVTDPNDIITQGMPLSFTGNEQIRVDSLFFTESDTNFKVLVKGDIQNYVTHNTNANPILKPWTTTSTVVPWMPFFPFVYRHNLEGGRMFHLAPGHNATTWTATNSNWNNLFLNGILYALNRPGYGGGSTAITKGPGVMGYALERFKNGKSQSLRFGIPQKSRVLIRLYSFEGKLMSTLANRTYKTGTYSVALPSGLRSSMYIVDFKAGNYHKTMKIVR